MTAIDFGNFPDVDMRRPGALGRAILSDFAFFNFTSGLFDPVEGFLDIPNHFIPESMTAFVRAHGDFELDFTGKPVPGCAVFAIEVWVPGGYRLIVDEIDVSFAELESALLARDLSPLWAGERLEILGTASFGDTLVGDSLADEIYGYGGNDLLRGGGGGDYLDGMAGADIMAGGKGDDSYAVDHVGDVVDERAGKGLDLVVSEIDYGLPQFVEDLGLLDEGGAIDAEGNALDNFITGNSSSNVILGLAGNDTLLGLEGRDFLNGGAGKDRLAGDAGRDVLRGGGEGDLLLWDPSDEFDGEAGVDTLIVDVAELNLRRVDDAVIVDVERIKLGAGANRLGLSASDVLAISTTTDTLRVVGRAGDVVNISASFTETGVVDGYTRYQSGAAVLLIDQDISVV
jgi:hypothetical protein